MTHEELLAEINEPNPAAFYTTKITTELAEQTEDYLITAFMKVAINPQVVIEQDALIKELKAHLRAVVELHRPVIHALPVETCLACQNLYPCSTIQAIEKQLK